MAPNLTPSRDGVLLSWLEPVEPEGAGDRTAYALRLAELSGDVWSAPQTIHAGDDFFANWADLPAVVEGTDGGRVAHWLSRHGEGTYDYGVHLAQADSGGWRPLGRLHDDLSGSEYGFVSWLALADGSWRAFWLDSRGLGEVDDGRPQGSMQLRTARLDEGLPAAGTLLDERVCECCSTDAALTAEGPIVVYRDRGDAEIRDITVVRATADGWSTPRTVHDDGFEIFGCPVNGPAVAADGRRVAVAWHTGAEPGPRVQIAFSDDAGASFAAPVVVDGDAPLGRVDVDLTADGSALVGWLGTTAHGAEVRWRRVSAAGELSPVRVVTATASSRSAGVPRFLLDGDRWLAAWVEASEPSRLRVAALATP